MLFYDDRFDLDGVPTFHWDPVFFGFGPDKFFFFSIQFIVLKEYNLTLHINCSQRQIKGGVTEV
jgi:hypothetical protein